MALKDWIKSELVNKWYRSQGYTFEKKKLEYNPLADISSRLKR